MMLSMGAASAACLYDNAICGFVFRNSNEAGFKMTLIVSKQLGIAKSNYTGHAPLHADNRVVEFVVRKGCVQPLPARDSVVAVMAQFSQLAHWPHLKPFTYAVRIAFQLCSSTPRGFAKFPGVAYPPPTPVLFGQ